MTTVPALTDSYKNRSAHILSHSRGPQFSAKGGVLLTFAAIFGLLFSFYALSMGYTFILLLFIGLLVPVVSYIIDIHGFELDTVEFKIREYKQF